MPVDRARLAGYHPVDHPINHPVSVSARREAGGWVKAKCKGQKDELYVHALEINAQGFGEEFAKIIKASEAAQVGLCRLERPHTNLSPAWIAPGCNPSVVVSLAATRGGRGARSGVMIVLPWQMLPISIDYRGA